MELWSLEDAEHWNELPLLERFSAYDYACLTDRSEAEALDILNDLANRRLINRTTRAGVDWFYVYSWPGALIPNLYYRIDKDFIEKNDRLLGVDTGNGAQYPIYDVFPVSAGVVEGGKLAPYRDWRAIFERNTVFTAQPCGCRNKAILRGHEEEHEEGICHCMVFGELAEFFIEGGSIAAVEVGENRETPVFGTRAFDQLPAEVVAANGTDVDIVAGATHTSIALLRAVADCIEQARG